MVQPPSQPHDGRASDTLASEQANPASTAIDRMSALEIVRLMNAEDVGVAVAVERELPRIAQSVEAIAMRMRAGGRLIYVGAGTSGRLAALDAVECPPTFNIAPERIVACLAGGTFAWTTAAEDVEDRADLGEADVTALGPRPADAVVGVTASGRTPYTLGGITAAHRAGALTMGIVCNPGTVLEQHVDLLIAPVVGPEVIVGSTRLKAGTAQKMVLNMLSTGTKILLGKAYGNLMVDVCATNAKLRARALAIVSAATGIDVEAAEALAAAGGEVKTAVVMELTGSDPDEARTRLATHDGVLRTALEARPHGPSSRGHMPQG